jgi:gamma-glutamylcyclotransferase (GGCT)/AIG2-like uncharacterized protein YtfP
VRAAGAGPSRATMAAVPERTVSLFVYGTLMPGQLRWPVLQPHARSTEQATTRGHLWDTGMGYPAARFDERGRRIPGALVTIARDVGPDVIAMLDRIEGEGVLFRRVEIPTSAGPALSYEWVGSTERLSPLPSGWPRRPAARPG